MFSHFCDCCLNYAQLMFSVELLIHFHLILPRVSMSFSKMLRQVPLTAPLKTLHSTLLFLNRRGTRGHNESTVHGQSNLSTVNGTWLRILKKPSVMWSKTDSFSDFTFVGQWWSNCIDVRLTLSWSMCNSEGI